MPDGEIPAPGDRLVQADLGRVPAIPLRRGARGRRRPHGADSRRCARRSIAATSRAGSSPTSAPTTGSWRPRIWNRSAAGSRLRCRAASGSMVKRWRCTPAAPGARGRSCSKRSRSRRQPGFGAWSTARTPTSMRSRRPSSSCSPTGKAISATRSSWTSRSIPSSARPTPPSGARRSIPGTHLPGCRFPARSPGTPRTFRRSPDTRSRRGHRPTPRSSASSTPRATGSARPPSDTSWDTPVVPGTGLAVSSRGAQSWAVHGHPSCIAPGKRPRLTPNPCFVLSPGRWIMPFGTPGGDTQIQANLQSLLNHLAFAMELQDAVEAPRLVTHSHPDTFAPHTARPGLVTLEGRIGRGHVRPARCARTSRRASRRMDTLDGRSLRGPQGTWRRVSSKPPRTRAAGAAHWAGSRVVSFCRQPNDGDRPESGDSSLHRGSGSPRGMQCSGQGRASR